jgi:hypothetical protein
VANYRILFYRADLKLFDRNTEKMFVIFPFFEQM